MPSGENAEKLDAATMPVTHRERQDEIRAGLPLTLRRHTQTGWLC